MMRRIVMAVALAALCMGCQSVPPTQYYTLNMEPSGTVQAPVNVQVDRVEVGEALSRRDIMIKEGPTEIEYYATSQWAAGLDELVRQKLQEEFGLAQEGRRTLMLAATINAFEQIDAPGGADARVKLTVDVREQNASRYDAPLMTRVYEAKKKAATERPADVAEALSLLVEQIAQQIAQDLNSLQ